MIYLIFLIFAIIGVAIFFRRLRKKEIEAFLGEDISMFEEISGDLPPGGSITQEVRQSPMAGLQVTDESETSAFELKDKFLDEISQSFLITLNKVVKDRYHILFRFPLNELVKSSEPLINSRLSQHQITCLLCEKEDLRLVCGIHLKGTSLAERELLTLMQNIFSQIDKPLFSFPKMTDYATAEIGDALKSLPGEGQQSKQCPRCGSGMSMRLATKGKNTGKTFWVCKKFPHCKGVVRYTIAV